MHNSTQSAELKEINLGLTQVLSAREWMTLACAYWSHRLAQLLLGVVVDESDQTHNSINFLNSQADIESGKIGLGIDSDEFYQLVAQPPVDSPLGRLANNYAWSAVDVALFIIAGLAETHEGYADIFRTINPEKRPRAATGLAAQLIGGVEQRVNCENALQAGPAIKFGALIVEGEGPLFTRHLKVADGLWSAVHGLDVWPGDTPIKHTMTVASGLQNWLDSEQCKNAKECLSIDGDVVVRLQGETIATAINRALCLADSVSRRAQAFMINRRTSSTALKLINLHCCARGLIPVLAIEDPSDEQQTPTVLANLPSGAVLLATTTRSACEFDSKPLINIHFGRLEASCYTQVWASVIPALKDKAAILASRFPVEPDVAAEVARDLSHLDLPTINDVAKQIRARASGLSAAGITLVMPSAGWQQLVLPKEQSCQLHESVKRLEYQSIVLNQWGFLQGKRGARGVRLLLAGPPGTGKTLSAEVIAKELGVDLLIVDISRVVSKWIGETEKNLEQAFQAAEQSKAVLLFDEADALFGKRTEVSDANDRNANLETAYLLTRLERFEGLVIMSTNMRNNIDPAFLRRIEYIIDFEEPDKIERKAIWECHVPPQAPIDKDVDFAELATMFSVVGGVIKNAVVSAAFSAAAAQRPICKNDFIQALRREYEKQGKAFPVVKLPNQGSSSRSGDLT
jgi:hypothetical protein